MRIGVPKEIQKGEKRVATSPEAIKKLLKLGFSVAVEAGAGGGCGWSDELLETSGATIAANAAALWSDSDIVLKVNEPTPQEVVGAKSKQVIACVMDRDEERLTEIAAKELTLLALNFVPRITRAQKLDVLSSMANIAGYRAVIEAAEHFPGFFGPQMTAAGKSPPAKVLIIGAGVAGLAAIGAARSLGAEVRAFDTRPEVKEQVESMGAAFLDLEFEEEGSGGGGYAKVMSQAFIDAEMALFLEQCKEVNIVITTALIPGRKAPILVTDEMLQALKPGSVVVDLAAQNGGNCEGTKPGEVVSCHGVTVIGYTDLPSRMAPVASRFFSTNLVHLMSDMGGAENFGVDVEDEVIRGALFTHQGKVLPLPARKPPKTPPPQADPVEEPSVSQAVEADEKRGFTGVAGLAASVGLIALSVVAPGEFLQHFTVFVLACIVGWQVVWNVTPALHTPLMSVTNAISGIILVGGLIQAGSGELDLAAILGAIAILVATINIAGGFLVTHRMLQMFRR